MLLPAFALLVLALMWSAVVYQVRQEKKSARFEAVLHSQSLAHTLAEHANHLLRQTDHATQLFKLAFEQSNGALRLAEFTGNNGMLDTLMPTKFNLPFARLDATGKVVDSSNGYFASDLRDQAFFKSHAASAEQRTVVATPANWPRGPSRRREIWICHLLVRGSTTGVATTVRCSALAAWLLKNAWSRRSGGK